MPVENIASSPELTEVDDNSLGDDELAAMHLVMGVASARSSEDITEDVNITNHTPFVPLPSLVDTMDPAVTRLQPLMEDQELFSEEVEEPEKLVSKAASFYIGGEDGGGGGRLFSPRASFSYNGRRPANRQESEEGMEVPTLTFSPPDGGYGWVIAITACFINMWIVGFIKSYGVLYVEIRNAFPKASTYHVSWLPSLLSTVGLLIAPVTGCLCRRFTSRKVSFFGGLLCSLGLVLASVATTMNQLILSIGLLTGFGAGLTTTPGILIVSLYFEKRRAFASAICVAGNALGGFILPPLVDYLLGAYGLKGCFLILAGLQLHICAASMLYRPILHHAIIQTNEDKDIDVEDGRDKPKPPPGSKQGDINAIKNGIPVTRSRARAFFKKLDRRRKKNMEVDTDPELDRQVSFLRTASMMTSVPDLTLYARSWSISDDSAVPLESKESVLHMVGSTLPIFAPHPSVLRLSSLSTEEGMGSPFRGSVRRLSRTALLSESRNMISRQNSIRVVQSRIMEPVEEGVDDGLPQENSNAPNRIDPIAEKYEQKSETASEEQEAEQKGCCFIFWIRTCQCDFSLFRSGLFWVIAFSVFLIASGAPFSTFYLPAYAEKVEVPANYIPILLSISAVLDLVGRLGIGFLSDLGIFQLHHIYITGALSASLAVLLIPSATSFSGLAALLSLYGIGVGSWFVMIPPLLAKHHGAAQLASSYGIVRLFNGVMNFASPQVTGVMFDATGNFLSIYMLMGSCMLTGTLLVMLIPLIYRYQQSQEPYTITPSST
ncbi:hypothetical protein Pmani_013916 [Petrolisthes manimaculis]|uniref:Uncharacterized protein n=1 Tax=Petrolisthes manimaculis TaxID=1843537 RepID=A0AAE1U8W9_9EUCA|nr:hypothetical protein Pmani_013916 [Petrolisthes manimaculis]